MLANTLDLVRKLKKVSKSKFGDSSPESSLFDTYYTRV